MLFLSYLAVKQILMHNKLFLKWINIFLILKFLISNLQICELLSFQQFVITKLLNIFSFKNIYQFNEFLCSIENNSLNKCSDSRKK